MKITVSLTPELAATILRKDRQLREGQSIAGLALRLGPDGGLLLYQPAEKNREAADILLADLRRASEQHHRRQRDDPDDNRGIHLGPSPNGGPDRRRGRSRAELDEEIAAIERKRILARLRRSAEQSRRREHDDPDDDRSIGLGAQL